MLYVLNTLTPVLLLIALGAGLRFGRFAPPEFFGGLNKFVFWVALPALLFYKIATAEEAVGRDAMWLLGVLLGVMGVSLVVALVAGKLLHMPGPSLGAMVQAAYRANLIFIGLPVIVFALSEAPRAGRLETVAVLAVAPLIPVYNIAAVVVLAIGTGAGDGWGRTLRRSTVSIVTNPLVIACVAAIPFWMLETTFPRWIDRTLTTLSGSALPLALVGIGARLRLGHVREHLGGSLLATGLRIVLGPLLAYGIATLLGLGGELRLIAVIYMAAPSAVASYVVTDQMGGDSELAAGAVVVSTIASLPVLAIILYLLA